MPNHVLWPNDTSPVKPTHKLRAMVAIARITTMDAVFTDSPNTCMTNGNAMTETVAIHRGRYFEWSSVLFIRISRCARRADHAAETREPGTSRHRSMLHPLPARIGCR